MKRRPGIARSFRANQKRTVWTAALRRDVTFQSGEPLDADAVLSNVDRWIRSDAGRALLPDLTAADSPRPGRVRFILDEPVKRFPLALADPRFGLVAPGPLIGLGSSAVAPRCRRNRAVRVPRAGRRIGAAGPQRRLVGDAPGARSRGRPGRPDRSTRGPVSGSPSCSAGPSRSPTTSGATPIDRIEAAPLLTAVAGRGATVGLERSVRGIDSATAVQSLADVWLTDLR